MLDTGASNMRPTCVQPSNMIDILGGCWTFFRDVGRSTVRPFRRTMSNPISSIPDGNGNSPVGEFGNSISPFLRVAVSYAGYGNIPDCHPVPPIKTLNFPTHFFQQSFSCSDSGINISIFNVQEKPFRIGKEPEDKLFRALPINIFQFSFRTLCCRIIGK